MVNIQLVLVGVCVIAALAFMGRKFYKAVRRKSGCDCEATCKNRTCAGGGACSSGKKLTELRPR